jgi:hypothetical protein
MQVGTGGSASRREKLVGAPAGGGGIAGSGALALVVGQRPERCRGRCAVISGRVFRVVV